MSVIFTNNDIKVFTEITGWNFGRLLGCGWHGCVYESNNNQVIKITGSEKEYLLAKYLQNKPNDLFCKIYKILAFEYKNFIWYGIIKENLHDWKEGTSRFISEEAINNFNTLRFKLIRFGDQINIYFDDLDGYNVGIRQTTGQLALRDFSSYKGNLK